MLINIEYSIIDVGVSEDECNIFRRLLLNLRVYDFEDDNKYEMWIQFKIGEILNLLEKLELLESIIMYNIISKYYCFHRKELLVYALIRLAYGFSYTVIADIIFGRDSRY